MEDQGQAYAKKLQELSLNDELRMEDGSNVRGGKDRIWIGTGARPKSPTKTQRIMAEKRTSAQPYNLPKATGPGGLVAMLDGLKKIRHGKNLAQNSENTVEETVEKMIIGTDVDKTGDKTLYFDANSTLPLNETLASTSKTLRALSDDLNNNRSS